MKWLSLLITAVCSQMLTWGLLLSAAGLVSFSGSISWLSVFLSLAIMASGPLVLGLHMNLGWRGFFAGVLSIPLGWLIGSITVNIPFLGSPFYSGIAGVMIIMILAFTQKIKSIKDFMWAMLGIGFGGILSVISLNFSNKSVSGIYIQFFLTFLWVWLSAIFFPDLVQRRAGRNDVIVWVAMMTVFPFIVDLIYTVVFKKV